VYSPISPKTILVPAPEKREAKRTKTRPEGDRPGGEDRCRGHPDPRRGLPGEKILKAVITLTVAAWAAMWRWTLVECGDGRESKKSYS